MTVKQMLEQLAVRMAALEGMQQAATTAPAVGQVQQITSVIKKRTVQAVSWFVNDKAHQAGDLVIQGLQVKAGDIRTQAMTFNTGIGRYGQEVIYVPQTPQAEALLVALRSGAPIVVSVGNVKATLTRI